jgi:alanine racemase
MKETFRCWAEIDRDALRHNVKIVRQRIGSAEMLAVVKANAYGHGLLGVAQTLADDAQLFGVANLEEALALRASLPHPIVILGPATPEERSIIAKRGFIPTISSLEEAEAFDQLGPVAINFKIDTGMGRMGVVENEAREVFKRVAELPKIDIHSVSTHMPVSNEDAKFTRGQLVRFRRIIERIRAEVPGSYRAHVLQSAGTLAFNPPRSRSCAPASAYGFALRAEASRPVMTWKTRIVLIRDMPKGAPSVTARSSLRENADRNLVGYADGIHGTFQSRRCRPCAGNVAPLTGNDGFDDDRREQHHNVQVGDEVFLWGAMAARKFPRGTR